jgi:hypothetical protein
MFLINITNRFQKVIRTFLEKGNGDSINRDTSNIVDNQLRHKRESIPDRDLVHMSTSDLTSKNKLKIIFLSFTKI